MTRSAGCRSAPKVTTQSGKEASIRVVTEFIYPTEFTPGTFGGGGGGFGGFGGSSGGGGFDLIDNIAGRTLPVGTSKNHVAAKFAPVGAAAGGEEDAEREVSETRIVVEKVVGVGKACIIVHVIQFSTEPRT